MILVDTSVWVDHLRKGNAALTKLLNAGRVLGHPFVLGEISLGSLKRRSVILGALRDLPAARLATDDEVLRFIEDRRLFALGIGYVDAHLVAAVQLTSRATLWTFDKRLKAVSEKLGIAATSL